MMKLQKNSASPLDTQAEVRLSKRVHKTVLQLSNKSAHKLSTNSANKLSKICQQAVTKLPTRCSKNQQNFANKGFDTMKKTEVL
jgi:hypothetical protein